MSHAAHPDATPAPAAPDAGALTRRTARPTRTGPVTRWATGVLTAGTVLLLGWTALVVLATWLFTSAYELVSARELGPVDLVAVAGDLAPGLLVGWCVGRAAAAALEGGQAMPPRAAGVAAGALGVAAGALGVAAGAVVLALTSPLL